MDKETFDKKVAAIWQVYEATGTLHRAGIGTRITHETTQEMLRRSFAELAEALAAGLPAPVGK